MKKSDPDDSNICLVCRKYIKKGGRAGFVNIHAGACADRWNSWPFIKKREMIKRNKGVPESLRK